VSSGHHNQALRDRISTPQRWILSAKYIDFRC